MFHSLMRTEERRVFMIDKEKNIEDELRSRNPFHVPEGYFEDFTAGIMRDLPKKAVTETKVVSFYDRVKPWLYMAAIFIGIIVLFNVLDRTPGVYEDKKPVLSSVMVDCEEGDDSEFFEIFEEMYADKYAISYIIDNYLID